MKKITFKSKTGAVVQGTLEEVLRVAAALGETVELSKLEGVDRIPGYYNSDSKGLIKMSDMSQSHIRMALLKRTRSYYQEMTSGANSLTAHQFKVKYTGLQNDPMIMELFAYIK